MGAQQAGFSPEAASSTARLRVWLWVSGACLLGQVFYTDYGAGSESQSWFWAFAGIALLWLVAKRRRGLARAFIIITALLGAVVFVAANPTGVHAWPLAALYLGQALPLLTPTVRAHVTGACSASSTLQVAA